MPKSLPAVWLAALCIGVSSPAAEAQTIGINLGATPKIVVAPGAKITVPIIVDLANVGADTLQTLEAALRWSVGTLTLDSIKAATVPPGWLIESTLDNAADGKIEWQALGLAALPATTTLANAYFTATAASGGTRVRVPPRWAASNFGVHILSLLRTRGLDVCVTGAGKWGDVTDDGVVNIIDAQQIAMFSVGLTPPGGSALALRGDVTASGRVDIIDAQQVARFTIGLTSMRTNTDLAVTPVTASITLSSAATQTLPTGTTLEIAATPRDAVGADITGCTTGIIWSSSNPAVAVATSDGVVYGQSVGTAVIRAASAANPAVNASVTVVVELNDPPTIAVQADSMVFTAWKEGANPAPKSTLVYNNGSGVMAQISIDTVIYGIRATGWLQTPGLNSAEAPATLTIQPLTAGLGAGAYSAIVRVKSKDAVNFSRDLIVTFDVKVAPQLHAIEEASGDSQSVVAGAEVVTRPTVRARDQYGDPLAGVRVAFTVSGPNGTLINAAGTTVTSDTIVSDASGIARMPRWRAENFVGTNTVVARVPGASFVPTATFTMNGIAGAAALMNLAAGNSQVAVVSTAVALEPRISVTDANGNGISGVPITFAVTAGNGSVVGGLQVTGADGKTEVTSWTLGAIIGTNTLTATATGLTPIVFTAQGTAAPPAQMFKSIGDNQTAVAGANVPTPPRVLVLDQAGNSVSGVAVVFAVAEGGGVLTGANVVTDVNGRASPTTWRLGTGVGRQSVTASVTGLPSVSFRATSTYGAPASVARWSQTGMYASAGATVASSPEVQVRDLNGNVVPGVTVTFTATAGGGSVGSSTVTTNSSGRAASSWTLGPGAGENTIQATVAGFSAVVFTATAILTIEIREGDNQSTATNTAVRLAPTVRVRGAYGEPMFYVPVTWTVISGGGYWSYTNSSDRTDQFGLTSVNWRLGPAVGTQILRASVPGAPPVDFTASGTNPCVEANFPVWTVAYVTGSLGAGDCHASFFNGLVSGVFDGFTFYNPSTQMVSFYTTATGYTPFMDLRAASNLTFPVTNSPAKRTIMPTGTYYLRTGAFGLGSTGTYSLSASYANESSTGCSDPPFVVAPILTYQQLTADDCDAFKLFDSRRRYDVFKLYAQAGKVYSIRQSSANFDTWMRLDDQNGLQLDEDDDSGGGTNSYIQYTASFTQVISIHASSISGGKSGSYTLQIWVK
jgi:hypothetical protein